MFQKDLKTINAESNRILILVQVNINDTSISVQTDNQHWCDISSKVKTKDLDYYQAKSRQTI